MNNERNMMTGAKFSECRNYRYALWRVWDESLPKATFIGLNPSTADETQDDPTIRRCIGFAKSWNYGGIYMLNLFAIRATDPKVMLAHDAPVGAMNDAALTEYARKSAVIVAAWGAHGSHMGRGALVADFVPAHSGRTLHCLGKTKAGHPKHPLYLKATTPLEVFAQPQEIPH